MLKEAKKRMAKKKNDEQMQGRTKNKWTRNKEQ